MCRENEPSPPYRAAMGRWLEAKRRDGRVLHRITSVYGDFKSPSTAARYQAAACSAFLSVLARTFSLSDFSCPQAARMSRPRGVRMGLA